jgi:hypothetical protein
MYLPNVIFAWLATGGIAALVLGARRAALLLLAPVICRFILIPVMPDLPNGVSKLLLVGLVPLIGVFGGILVLKQSVQAIYGRQAAGHVAGTYLVRAFDALGGLIGLIAFVVLGIWAWSQL